LKIFDTGVREVLVSRQKQLVEVKPSYDGVIELRYYDRLRSSRYYSWEIPVDEANELARWWKNEAEDIENGQFPIVDKKFGKVLISMFVQTRVEMRPLGRFGRPKFHTYSLPRTVVESLVTFLGQVRPGSGEKEPGKCSTRSL
jgi:hypothetical protein